MGNAERWRLLVEAGIIACIVKIGLRLTSYARINTTLRWFIDPEKPETGSHTIEELYEEASRAVSKLPGRSTCLVRALAGRTLLARYGYQTTIRFGVRQAKGESLHAHAWLETSDGTALGDSGGTESFVQLQSAQDEQ